HDPERLPVRQVAGWAAHGGAAVLVESLSAVGALAFGGDGGCRGPALAGGWVRRSGLRTGTVVGFRDTQLAQWGLVHYGGAAFLPAAAGVALGERPFVLGHDGLAGRALGLSGNLLSAARRGAEYRVLDHLRPARPVHPGHAVIQASRMLAGARS